MNWQRGLKRLRIVFSFLGFLAGLIVFGIVSFTFCRISDIAQTLSNTRIELYHLEDAETISVPGSSQPKFRFKRFNLYYPNESVEELDAESYQRELKELRNSVNGVTRDLNSVWKGWLVTTIICGFFSFIGAWFILSVISWIILGFIEKKDK
jgi:hypothetical protein